MLLVVICGSTIASSIPNIPRTAPFSPREASFGLIPDQNILMVLEGGEVKAVLFQKFYNDSLFYGEEPYSGVPLGSVSTLWSEGQDIAAGALGSSCGLAGGLGVSAYLLIISIESINDLGLIGLAAIPLGGAVLGGKCLGAKTTWHLAYRAEIPRSGWDYDQGYAAGEKLASAKPTWFLPGFFYNYWAVQTSRKLIPCPPTSEMEHKSKAYVAGLIDGYSDQTSLYNTIYSGTGCVLGTGAVFFVFLLMSMGAAYGN
ncbi:MAG: hypothetical protein HQ556_00040 [Candidatus Marinimicrobia bacterium]|nr:hypothetical protein [Candidatus Neomarinimicrobiota bacterium]